MYKVLLVTFAVGCLMTARATDVDAKDAKITALEAEIAALKAKNRAQAAEIQAVKPDTQAIAAPAWQGGQGCKASTPHSAGAALAWKACPVPLLGESFSASGFDWSQCKSEGGGAEARGGGA